MSVINDDKMAEGNLDEQGDPPTPLKTSLIPTLQIINALPPSLTGTTELLKMSESDDNVEYQDANLTTSETNPVTDKELAENSDDKVSVAPAKATEKKLNNDDQSLVLVVEDTVELGEVIIATLENMGLKTAYATHGKIGLEKMRELSPTILIMDIGLPDITGWKMLDEVREHYEKLKIQPPIIIVITAYGDPANRLIGKLQNIYTYLLKPFTPDEVETIVRMALAGEAPPDGDEKKSHQ